MVCFEQSFWSNCTFKFFPLVPLLNFASLIPLEFLYKRLDQRVCWFVPVSVWQPPSLPPSSQHVLHQELLLAVPLPVTRHSPSQTCDESSVKSTTFIPGRRQKGYLCGKAVFSRCKLLGKWDRILPEPGMSKLLCHGYTPHLALSVTEPWKSREEFLYHTSLFPAAPQGCQVCDTVEEPTAPR